jgi:hypothetical protein
MIGFIITRYVNSELTNNYWINCIKQIRKFYKLNKIVIIDDNSNSNFVKNNDENILENCVIIESEYKGRGELLPYYYLYKNKFFDKAIIIHDSVFIQQELNINEEQEVQFLWDVNNHFWNNVEKEKELIMYLDNNDELLELYNNKLWNICFGVMSFIQYDFLKIISEKYNFFNLLEYVTCRSDRSCLERIFPLLCSNENKNLINNNALFGSIFTHKECFCYTYEKYLLDVENNDTNLQCVKVWSGR